MNGKIRTVQTAEGFVARCPIHGDLPDGSGRTVFTTPTVAAVICLAHALTAFHGEGARR